MIAFGPAYYSQKSSLHRPSLLFPIPVSLPYRCLSLIPKPLPNLGILWSEIVFPRAQWVRAPVARWAVALRRGRQCRLPEDSAAGSTPQSDNQRPSRAPSKRAQLQGSGRELSKGTRPACGFQATFNTIAHQHLGSSYHRNPAETN